MIDLFGTKWEEVRVTSSNPIMIGDAIPFTDKWEVIVDRGTVAVYPKDGAPVRFEAAPMRLGSTGWGGTRRARRQEIEVLLAKDLLVGDILIGYNGSPDLWKPGCFITGIFGPNVQCHTRVLTCTWERGPYRLLRADYELGSAQQDSDPERFPHTCPSCGGRAYVGFSVVEHEDPKKNLCKS